MERNERSLVERCIEFDFSMIIKGIEYCRLGMNPNRKIECDYIAEIPDHNGLRPCLLTYYFNTNTKMGRG